MLLSVLLLALATVLPQHAVAMTETSSPATVLPIIPKSEEPPNYKECTSIDIRNECDKMHLLDNCTIVTGYVMITLLPVHRKCNFSEYSYPKLLEITDFMLFTEVRGLMNITYMFPNLTVIRGRKLFLNYALGITNMPDLQQLEFPSLVAIQRGHVYIGTCPKLCEIESVDWDRLTLSPGENHIFLNFTHCTKRALCTGCKNSHCWSQKHCQLFENDGRGDKNTHQCHEQCLGGCTNETAADCTVCREFSDNGVCVKNCPKDKFKMEQYQRCYTREQCIKHPGHYTYNSECVTFCPSGFKADDKFNCVLCDPNEACVSVCSPELENTAYVIYNLADVEELRGCQILNGSLIITIRNKVDEQQLIRGFATLREIRGHLKIIRSQLTSLQFLQELTRIHGDPMENAYYSLIIYDNKNLTKLWKPNENLEIVRGHMFMHRNNKLCNHIIDEFQTNVIHEKPDSLQMNDQEVSCGPSKLQLITQVINHTAIQLSWPKSQTSEEIEVVYKPLSKDQEKDSAISELDAPVCTRINWQRRLLFPDELILSTDNSTHYSYTLVELQPNTSYICLVRTFGGSVNREARSDFSYVTTKPDKPRQPKIELFNKTNHSLTLQITGDENSTHSYYSLNVYELTDDASYIEKRDYCKQRTYVFEDTADSPWYAPPTDYDDCCAYQAKLEDDRQFIENMREQYRCSLDAPTNCLPEKVQQEAQEPLRQVTLESNTTFYELQDLKRFRLYSVQLRACNELGCSSHSILNERTNYTQGADLPPYLNACRVPDSDEYMVRFGEPLEPNGAILSYVVHYRPTMKSAMQDSTVSCVTRRDHSLKNFVHIRHYNVTYNECAVRVHSLADAFEDAMTSFVNITMCDANQRTTPKPLNVKTTPKQPKLVKKEPPETEVSHARGISIFVICFLFGCVGSIMWIMHKRRCWRRWPGLRRYVPVREEWLRERQPPEDRQILVDGFETVRFHNNQNGNSSSHENEDN